MEAVTEAECTPFTLYTSKLTLTPMKQIITLSQASEYMKLVSGTRPRISGIIKGGIYDGQTVAIRSAHDLNQNAFLEVWLSNTTLADLITCN